MKSLLLYVLLIFTINFQTYSQGSFLIHENLPNNYSEFYYCIEKNGVLYLAGGFGDYIVDSASQVYLVKMSTYGNIFKEYFSHEPSTNQSVFEIDFPDDSTIRLFISSFGHNKTKLKIQDLDTNFNLRNEKVFYLKDSVGLGLKDITTDDVGNYYIVGHMATHPHNYFVYDKELILKLSPSLDSLDYHEQTGGYFLNILFNPHNSSLYIAGESYDLLVFDTNLDYIKTIRVDTVTAYIFSHLQLDENKFVVAGHQWELLRGNHRYLVFRTVDSLGVGIDYAEVDADDTISSIGFGTMISLDHDSSNLYFTWVKNDNFVSFCNNGEPSFIGVGKFKKDLTPEWVKYYGNGIYYYEPIHQAPTKDGGLIVTGYFNHCEVYEPYIHYFVLKVDSTGNYTYLKEIETPRVMMKVFPNPATDYLRVEIEDQDAQIECIRIIAMDGKEMRNINSTSNHELINLQDLPCGTYTIEIKDGKGRMIYSKFVKQ